MEQESVLPLLLCAFARDLVFDDLVIAVQFSGLPSVSFFCPHSLAYFLLASSLAVCPRLPSPLMARTTRHATLSRNSSFANGEVCARESSINLPSQVSALLKPFDYFLKGAQASPSEFLREAIGVYGKFDRYVSDERLLEMLSGRSEAIIASTFKQAQPDEQNLVLNKAQGTRRL